MGCPGVLREVGVNNTPWHLAVPEDTSSGLSPRDSLCGRGITARFLHAQVVFNRVHRRNTHQSHVSTMHCEVLLTLQKDGTSFLSAKHVTASPIISPTSALFRSLRHLGPSVALPPRHSFPRCVRSRHLCRQQTSLLPRSKSSSSLPVEARRVSDTMQARGSASAISIASVASTQGHVCKSIIVPHSFRQTNVTRPA